MKRHLAAGVIVAGGVATAMLAIDLGACSSDNASPALTCRLGGKCSPAQVCVDGIEGCVSNCQCAGGTWQAPCPADTPANGSSCTAQGAACGYMATGTECGSVNCDCQGGAWACGPSCVTPPDAGSDAPNACIEAGGECLFPYVICAVPGPLSCGGPALGSYCCMSNVADCGQPSETVYACPPGPPEGGGVTCGSAPVPLGAPNYEALVQADDGGASYPVGCRATFPACNNGHVPYCTCDQPDVSELPHWTCFP